MALPTSLSCFSNRIGVDAECLSDPVPDSGLYINKALRGLSIKAAGDTANSEWTNGIQFLKDLINNTITEECQTFGAMVSKHLQNNPVREIVKAGMFDVQSDSADAFLAVSAKNRGIEICIPPSMLKRVRIHSIDAYTNTTGARAILIQDGRKAAVSNAITLTANEVSSVQVGTQYEHELIRVYWDTSDISVNDSALYVNNCQGCGSIGGKGHLHYNDVKIRGIEDLDNDSYVSACTYGLRVNFTVECAWEPLLCMLKEKLDWIFIYKVGVNFVEELRLTDRYNAITTAHREDYLAMLDPKDPTSWLSKYEGLKNDFAESLETEINRFAGDCFPCKKSYIGTIRV